MTEYQRIVDRIRDEQNISLDELQVLLAETDERKVEYLYQQARQVADSVYGNKIFMRGLIEFTNYCKNDCYYCGIRRSNQAINRYRLTKETILECCEIGYQLGFRTFVLQGGEDGSYTDAKICNIVEAIRKTYPDCAITLSLGEKTKQSYQRFFDAGANRYLLRHETANELHYNRLHPDGMSLQQRKQCLWDLKEIGYQVGCGIMVGSPYQTTATIYEDLCFMKELEPQMIGIGPFIPQKDTPFANEESGTLEMTRKLLAIVRLMHPHVLLPATTALGTIHPKGRELGILSGANVVMPNLSPLSVRDKYCLYDNKLHQGKEAAEGVKELQDSLESIGYTLVVDRGDYH